LKQKEISSFHFLQISRSYPRPREAMARYLVNEATVRDYGKAVKEILERDMRGEKVLSQ
jgi:hypothetical protein